MRYGEYSKAGEFTYDRPFLWGSKRTGPDLARIGGKYPDAWHVKHFENPQDFVHPKSNMPEYGWLAERGLKPSSLQKRMEVNGFLYTPEEMEALSSKTELDALVAYMQVIGTAVKKSAPSVPVVTGELSNPYAGDAKVVHRGEELYETHCQMCHGYEGAGDIGPEIDGYEGDDADIYEVIAAGVEGEMPAYGNVLEDRDIWYIVTYMRSLAAETLAPAPAGEGEAVNPLAGDPVAIEEGAEIYSARCALCHGKELEGGIGPSFFSERIAADDNELYYAVISKGREGGMPSFGSQLTEEQVWKVVSFIRASQTRGRRVNHEE